MTDTFNDNKMDWGYINAQEPELPAEEPGVEWLYDFEFMKDGMVTGTYTAVFDHILSREEVVRYFRQFYEVKNEHYKLRFRPPVPIFGEERQLVIDGLKRELGGFMRMAAGTVDLQDETTAIQRYVDSPGVKKQIDKALKRKRYDNVLSTPVITSKEV